MFSTVIGRSGDSQAAWREPYRWRETVGVLADRDVISHAFCLDGSPLLSLARGACLTGALAHRRQSLQGKEERRNERRKDIKKERKKGRKKKAVLSGSDGRGSTLVVQPRGLLATYSIISTAQGSSFVPVCICFRSGDGSALRSSVGSPCKFRKWLVA